VLTDVVRKYQADTGNKVETTFAASGLLRKRLEQGEKAEVFASAKTEHPEELARNGKWESPKVFTRNVLCALAQPGITVGSDRLLDILLDPAIRVGTSTPKADPSGDYAWELFLKAEALRHGAFATLDTKARKLTRAANPPRPPGGRGTYEWVMSEGQAEIFLTYCTNAVAAKKAQPQLQVVEMPAGLQVGAAYSLAVREDAPDATRQFGRYLLSPEAQAVVRQYGFRAP
jgi:molybdate transport system substrate-binding protein